jgi:hypothetical protein
METSISSQQCHYDMMSRAKRSGPGSYGSKERSQQRNQRLRFALFIKILLKRIEVSGDTILHHRVKHLLSSITRRRSQMGRVPPNDYIMIPLVDLLESQLRDLVGEIHWRRAHGYMRFYISRKEDFLPPPKKDFHNISHAA